VILNELDLLLLADFLLLESWRQTLPDLVSLLCVSHLERVQVSRTSKLELDHIVLGDLFLQQLGVRTVHFAQEISDIHLDRLITSILS